MAIALHPEVEVTVTLNIARSAEEAERQSKGEMLTTAEAIYGDDINENARPENFFDPNDEEEGEETPSLRIPRRPLSGGTSTILDQSPGREPGFFMPLELFRLRSFWGIISKIA